MKKIKNNLQKAKMLINPLFIDRNLFHRMPHQSVASRIIVEPELKFVYIRIPKAANSTVTKLILNCMHKNQYKAAEYNHNYKKSFKNAKQVTLKQARLAKKNYVFFVVVRNPYDRILSAYLNKFSKEKYVKRFGKQIAEAGDGNLNFKSFCYYLCQNNLYKNPHWIPQSEYIWPSYERLDYIGKVENLKNDLENIFLEVFDNCNIDTTYVYGPEPTNANSKKDEYYDKETKKIINKLYANDFKMFNYKFE